MTEDDRQSLEAELSDLQRKLSKRKDMPGFSENAAALEARIAEVEAQLTESTSNEPTV